MARATYLIALMALASCHRSTSGEVGVQDRRDAFPMATMQASRRAADASGNTPPEGSTRGAVQQPPERR